MSSVWGCGVMCDDDSNVMYGLPNGKGIDSKLEGICNLVGDVETVLVLMAVAKTDMARRGLESQIRELNSRVITFVGWIQEDLSRSKKLLSKQGVGESEVLYLLRSCEQRVFSKCGREFEMDCDEHETCEFRQRLRNEISCLENVGGAVE